MEFPFETLEVYQKALELYRAVSREAGENPGGAAELKRGILALCQGIVTGAGCWNRESKVRYFLQAQDMSRCLAPLVEGAVIDCGVTASSRESLREEIDGLSKMLSSLARKTREWAQKTEGDTGEARTQAPITPSGNETGKMTTAGGKKPARTQGGRVAV